MIINCYALHAQDPLLHNLIASNKTEHIIRGIQHWCLAAAEAGGTAVLQTHKAKTAPAWQSKCHSSLQDHRQY
jgi:hypothetical protein